MTYNSYQLRIGVFNDYNHSKFKVKKWGANRIFIEHPFNAFVPHFLLSGHVLAGVGFLRLPPPLLQRERVQNYGGKIR